MIDQNRTGIKHLKSLTQLYRLAEVGIPTSKGSGWKNYVRDSDKRVLMGPHSSEGSLWWRPGDLDLFHDAANATDHFESAPLKNLKQGVLCLGGKLLDLNFKKVDIADVAEA